MRIFQTAIVAGLALLVIAGVWRLGKEGLRQRQAALEARSMVWMNQLQKTREAGHDSSIEKAKQELADLERAQELEWQSVLGGRGGRAIKDPGFSLETLIREWASSIVPTDSRVVAQVDRFVEFSLLIELSRNTTEEEVAQWTRSILSRLSTYLYGIRFSREGIVFASFDRGDVEALGDGAASVSTQAIVDRFKDQERLMAQGAVPSEESSTAEASPRLRSQAIDSASAVFASVDGRALFDAFARRFETNLVQLIEIQDELRLMRNVDEVITRVSLTARVERLSQDLRVVQSRRLMLMNPALEWDQSLGGESGDKTLRRATAQNIISQYQANIEGEKLFEALKAQCESVEKYLAFLSKTADALSIA